MIASPGANSGKKSPNAGTLIKMTNKKISFFTILMSSNHDIV